MFQFQKEMKKAFPNACRRCFTISGRGTVVTGRIESGIVETGDPLEIVGISTPQQQHVLVSRCSENHLMKEELVKTVEFF